MKTIADIDALTGLYNRNAFYRFCQDVFNRCSEDSSVSIVIVELGQLKQVNYQYDHALGDKVLTEVSKIIFENFRQDDICARLGGQKFAVICPNSNFVEDSSILERLYQAIESLNVVYNSETVEFSASIGATTKLDVNAVDPIAAIETMISAANLMVVNSQSNQLHLSTNYS